MTIRLLFEPRDLWIGVYWKTAWEGPDKTLTLFICIIPCLPIRLSFVVYSLLKT
jgi:hypothetical protein